MSDLIRRQDAIDAPERFIKDCNPEHFVGHQKFIEYMDNAEIGSFGNWQFANGFNMGLTAAEVAIEKLPSAQPTIDAVEVVHGEWVGVHEYIDHLEKVTGEKFQISNLYDGCNFCNNCWYSFPRKYNYCPNCGANMDGKRIEK